MEQISKSVHNSIAAESVIILLYGLELPCSVLPDAAQLRTLMAIACSTEEEQMTVVWLELLHLGTQKKFLEMTAHFLLICTFSDLRKI